MAKPVRLRIHDYDGHGTGEMGIQSLPLSKSKRKFRLRRIPMHRARSAALWAVLLFLSSTGSRLALAQGGLQRVNHIIIVMQDPQKMFGTFGAR
jgi:hypothetical protein